MRVSAKELRTHTRRLLDALDRGEDVVITYRGKARARVVPIEGSPGREELLELFGIWKDHGASEDVERYVDELRTARTT